MYWVSSYAWDIITYLILTMIIFILFLSFELAPDTGRNAPAILLLLLGYGVSTTPLMYCVTSFSKVPSTACITTICVTLSQKDQDADWIYHGTWGMLVSVFGMVLGFAGEYTASKMVSLLAWSWVFGMVCAFICFGMVFGLVGLLVVLMCGVICTIFAMAVIAFIQKIRTARDGSGSVQEYQPRTGEAWTIMSETLHQAKFWRFFAITTIFIWGRSNFSHMDATFPKYSTREFGEDFPYELHMAINPTTIIFLVPLFAYLSGKFQLGVVPVFIIGSMCSGVSPLFLAVSNSVWASVMWLVMLSVGEAIWSPKLIEYSVAIAPEGREGTYLSLSQAPLFVAKFATGGFSGWLLETYCPQQGTRDPKMMWLGP